jgi:hypothetical protein
MTCLDTITDTNKLEQEAVLINFIAYSRCVRLELPKEKNGARLS